MATIDNIVNDLKDAINTAGTKKTSAYDTQAVVNRIEGDTAWVHIPGGVDETPVKLTIAAHTGDTVQVRVSGGRAFLVGNGSAPPTDDTTAIHARTIAVGAQNTADSAIEDAARAKEAADVAETEAARAGEAANMADENANIALQSANAARGYANEALTELSEVVDVVGVLKWIAEHGEYIETDDDEVIAGKFYFNKYPVYELTKDTAIVTGKSYYTVTLVAQPTQADINTYYVLNTTGDKYIHTEDKEVSDDTDYYVFTIVDTPDVQYISTYYEVVDYTYLVSDISSEKQPYDIYTHTTDTFIEEDKNYYTVVGTVVQNPVNKYLYLYYELKSDPTRYDLTSDLSVDAQKTYYTLTGTEVANPDVSDILTYYELSIGEHGLDPAGLYELDNVDDSVSTYVSSHLALTSNGLYVFSDQDSGRVLLSNDGVHIEDENGNVVAKYGENTTIGDENGMHIEIAPGFLGFYDSAGSDAIAYIANNMLWIPKAVVVDSIQVGDATDGAWQWIVQPNRNLTLVWVVED